MTAMVAGLLNQTLLKLLKYNEVYCTIIAYLLDDNKNVTFETLSLANFGIPAKDMIDILNIMLREGILYQISGYVYITSEAWDAFQSLSEHGDFDFED